MALRCRKTLDRDARGVSGDTYRRESGIGNGKKWALRCHSSKMYVRSYVSLPDKRSHLPSFRSLLIVQAGPVLSTVYWRHICRFLRSTLSPAFLRWPYLAGSRIIDRNSCFFMVSMIMRTRSSFPSTFKRTNLSRVRKLTANVQRTWKELVEYGKSSLSLDLESRNAESVLIHKDIELRLLTIRDFG